MLLDMLCLTFCAYLSREYLPSLAIASYVKKNTVSSTGKAFAKVLIFEAAKIIFQFLQTLVSIVGALNLAHFDEKSSASTFVFYYLIQASYYCPSLLSCQQSS